MSITVTRSVRGLAAIVMAVMAFAAGCSKKTVSYDSLEAEGQTEATVRRQYSEFFDLLTQVTETAEPDSILLNRMFDATDVVVHAITDFPGTLESRLALDALSYGAKTVANAQSFRKPVVREYWRVGLMEPILIKSRVYVRNDRHNESSQVQLVKAIQRGAGSRVTDDMLLDLIPLVGPVPSDSLLAICEADTLALRRIHDLLLYSRSLQEIGPPLWMATGDWLMVVDVDGSRPGFYGLRTRMIDSLLYVTFRDFSPGTVYEKVCRDSLPPASADQDAWLKRATAWLDSLTIDAEFASSAQTSGLPLYDAHNIYNDYMIAAYGDSVKKQFDLIIKRQAFTPNSFQFAGVDSIDVVFDVDQITQPGEPITLLNAHRYLGGSMSNGQYVPPKSSDGHAYIMPLGRHDPAILQRLIDARRPIINVNTTTVQ